LIAILLLITLVVAALEAAPVGGCPVFPDNNIWNVPVDRLPVHPDSAAYIQPDFGTGLYQAAAEAANRKLVWPAVWCPLCDRL
jgi:hypothetical protein